LQKIGSRNLNKIGEKRGLDFFQHQKEAKVRGRKRGAFIQSEEKTVQNVGRKPRKVKRRI